VHEALTLSLSHPMGEGGRRSGEGLVQIEQKDLGRFGHAQVRGPDWMLML